MVESLVYASFIWEIQLLIYLHQLIGPAPSVYCCRNLFSVSSTSTPVDPLVDNRFLCLTGIGMSHLKTNICPVVCGWFSFILEQQDSFRDFKN